MAQCQECGVTETFPTQLQREKWIHKRHIGHTLWLWRAQPVNR